jgi:pyruvate/2-oxoglutarate dehydrogenase complex dihydrolipoamide acyltransferase (E2) component
VKLKIVIMPRLDEVQQNGRVVKWNKKQGDKVSENEVLAEAMSEKITFDIVAPVSGILHRIFVEEEVDVPIGKAIAIVREDSDNATLLDEKAKQIRDELSSHGVRVRD